MNGCFDWLPAKARRPCGCGRQSVAYMKVVGLGFEGFDEERRGGWSTVGGQDGVVEQRGRTTVRGGGGWKS